MHVHAHACTCNHYNNITVPHISLIPLILGVCVCVTQWCPNEEAGDARRDMQESSTLLLIDHKHSLNSHASVKKCCSLLTFDLDM